MAGSTLDNPKWNSRVGKIPGKSTSRSIKCKNRKKIRIHRMIQRHENTKFPIWVCFSTAKDIFKTNASGSSQFPFFPATNFSDISYSTQDKPLLTPKIIIIRKVKLTVLRQKSQIYTDREVTGKTKSVTDLTFWWWHHISSKTYYEKTTKRQKWTFLQNTRYIKKKRFSEAIFQIWHMNVQITLHQSSVH